MCCWAFLTPPQSLLSSSSSQVGLPPLLVGGCDGFNGALLLINFHCPSLRCSPSTTLHFGHSLCCSPCLLKCLSCCSPGTHAASCCCTYASTDAGTGLLQSSQCLRWWRNQSGCSLYAECPESSSSSTGVGQSILACRNSTNILSCMFWCCAASRSSWQCCACIADWGLCKVRPAAVLPPLLSGEASEHSSPSCFSLHVS